jgi:hypothetical protein
VGAIIRAIGPSPISTGFWSAMWRNSGRRYARVLPEPLGVSQVRDRRSCWRSEIDALINRANEESEKERDRRKGKRSEMGE